ncbi:hypothetical protein ACP70R_022550 [Stipagrostis hirtigluma subsp. patula]
MLSSGAGGDRIPVKALAFGASSVGNAVFLGLRRRAFCKHRTWRLRATTGMGIEAGGGCWDKGFRLAAVWSGGGGIGGLRRCGVDGDQLCREAPVELSQGEAELQRAWPLHLTTMSPMASILGCSCVPAGDQLLLLKYRQD